MSENPGHPGEKVIMREDGIGAQIEVFWAEKELETATLDDIPKDALVWHPEGDPPMWMNRADVAGDPDLPDEDRAGEWWFVRAARPRTGPEPECVMCGEPLREGETEVCSEICRDNRSRDQERASQ